MVEGDVITLLRDAIIITIKLSGPLLVIGMLVGLIISVVQTTTSIQEQTLTFVPKLIAILVAVVVFASIGLTMMKDYTVDLFRIIGTL